MKNIDFKTALIGAFVVLSLSVLAVAVLGVGTRLGASGGSVLQAAKCVNPANCDGTPT